MVRARYRHCLLVEVDLLTLGKDGFCSRRYGIVLKKMSIGIGMFLFDAVLNVWIRKDIINWVGIWDHGLNIFTILSKTEIDEHHVQCVMSCLLGLTILKNISYTFATDSTQFFFKLRVVSM